MASNGCTSTSSFRQPAWESRNQDSPGRASASGAACDQSDPSILSGDSVAVRRLRSQIQRIAPYFRIALIRGDAGSGKQQVARAIHALSPGSDGPFVVTTAYELAQPFVDPQATRPVCPPALESANGGTMYVKGVDGLSFVMQAALFRFFHACEERRTSSPNAGRGSLEQPGPSLSGTRILAASDRDLRTLSAIGQYRQDLYACLSAVEIFVPPLRQRVEDIPALAQWLLRGLTEKSEKDPKLLAEATLIHLQERPWPSNLRELKRVIAQASALAEGTLIEPRHLLALVESGTARSDEAKPARLVRLHDVVQQHVIEVLSRCGGNKLRAAELLGISRSTLYRMLDATPVHSELR